MSRLLITKVYGARMLCLEEDRRITGICPEDPENFSDIGKIYVGHVKHIKKDIRAAFIEYAPGKMCYYPLDELSKYPVPGVSVLHEGDDFPVRIDKDPVKMKAAVATSNFSFTGYYLVVMSGKKGISFSTKIQDPDSREHIRKVLGEVSGAENAPGIIVRTNAADASDSAVIEEYDRLKSRMEHVFTIWKMRKAGTLLWEPEDPIIPQIYNNQISKVTEIVTDLEEIKDMLSRKQEDMLKADPKLKLPKIRLYDDTYPLIKLYRLETEMERALDKRVWLKSGGFLIIEPTEALVSIDVNTGKSDGKKTPEETFYKTNLEAAREIAVQLRLRNLSGIIIIDFIDMKEETHRRDIINELTQALSDDPEKTAVLGFTKLGLLEMTRRKNRKPLHEIMKTITAKERK